MRKWTASNKEKVHRRNAEYRKRDNGRTVKNSKLKMLFGITLEDYDRMLAEQNGVCAICEQPERAVHRKNGKVKQLAIDHCHESGAVRGLLCSLCNTALGLFQDDSDLLAKAMRYLAHSEKP